MYSYHHVYIGVLHHDRINNPVDELEYTLNASKGFSTVQIWSVI